MTAKSLRPRLSDADRRLRRTLGLLAILFLGFALLLIGEAQYGKALLGEEDYKLVLQFFLVTTGGGMLLAIVANARDEAKRRQERAASILELDRQLDAAYRALKKIKRRLRAHRSVLSAGENIPSGKTDASQVYTIGASIFEKAMDDLLDAQVELEGICDHIRQRDDVLNPARLERMRGPLRYVARYYHDVYEDFEQHHIKRDGDNYLVGGATNLHDFLRSSHDKPSGLPRDVEFRLAEIGNTRFKLSKRADAFREVEAILRKPKKEGGELRHRKIAEACFALLSDELAAVTINLLS